MSFFTTAFLMMTCFSVACIGAQRPQCSTGAYPVLQFSNVGWDTNFKTWWICVRAEPAIQQTAPEKRGSDDAQERTQQIDWRACDGAR